jgi:hypothetical protein
MDIEDVARDMLKHQRCSCLSLLINKNVLCSQSKVGAIKRKKERESCAVITMF